MTTQEVAYESNSPANPSLARMVGVGSMEGTLDTGAVGVRREGDDPLRTTNSTISVVLATAITAAGLQAALSWVYAAYVCPHFSASFSCEAANVVRIVEVYLLATTLAAGLGASLKLQPRASGIAAILQYVIVVSPLLTIYSQGQTETSFMYLVLASFLTLVVATHALPVFRIPLAGRSLRAVVLLGLWGVGVYVYGALLWSGAASWFSVDFSGVYETRGYWTSVSLPLLGYFVPWQANVINPALLAVGLHRKSLPMIAVALLLQLLLFGMTGHKSFALAMVLVVVVYWVFRRRWSLWAILLASGIGIVAAYLIYLLSGDELVPSIFIRRLFFVPARNHAVYYDFFSSPTHPHILLSNSILAPFTDYPYAMSVPRVISWAYWGRDFSPNVGYMANAYAQFGGLGMILFSLILAVILRLADSLSERREIALVAAVIGVPAMALVNSALFTTLLTHGLLLALVVAWLAGPRDRRQLRQSFLSGIWGRRIDTAQRRSCNDG